jgi:hypothetical protein
MRDTAWPRPFPYPDDWLKRWSDRIDAEYPLPLRYMRWGGFGELQGRVRAWTISALFAAAIGVAILLWTRDGRRRSRWPSVRRGVAIGLLVGLAWATALGHAERERLSSVWSAFFLWGFVFAFTGAVVGAVRSYPELVGLIVSPLAASLVRHSSTAGTGISQIVDEFMWSLAGAPGGLIIFLVYFLFWGLVIGALHRRFRGRQFDPRTFLSAPRTPAGEYR